MAAYGKSEHPKVQLDGRSLGLPVVHQSGDDEFLLDIGDVNTADVDELLEIFEEVLKDGQSYPQESTTRQAFVDYFFGLYTFVVRSSKVSTGSQKGKVVAGFYIKSNFPGTLDQLILQFTHKLFNHCQYRSVIAFGELWHHGAQCLPRQRFSELYGRAVCPFSAFGRLQGPLHKSCVHHKYCQHQDMSEVWVQSGRTRSQSWPA